MKQPLISIIVPIYNAENYLARCVDSLLAQTMQDFEILLVNDGSEDSSEEICKEYVSKDGRIKLFTKPNGGVSSARNYAIERAEGEYLMFVDADDWLDTDTIEQCYPYLGSYDMVKFGAKMCWDGGDSSEILIEDNPTYREIQSRTITRTTIVAPWGMLVRKSIFDQHSIRFDHRLVLAEDWLVYAQLVLYIKTFKFLPKLLAYNYYKGNKNSCTNNITLEKLLNVYYVIDKLQILYGAGYEDDFRYTKVTCLRSILVEVGRMKAVRWLSKEEDISKRITFRDIRLVKDVKSSTKRRLFKLLYQAYLLKGISMLCPKRCKN